MNTTNTNTMTPEAIRTKLEENNYKIKIIMSTGNILVSKGQLSWSFETWSDAYTKLIISL